MATSAKKEQIIAKEIFSPVLSEEYEKRFDKLKAHLQNLLPMNYIEAIKKEKRVALANKETMTSME